MRPRRMSANPTTNIYDNHDVAMPDNAYFGGNYHDPLVTSRSRTQGWLLSDTLGFFNDKVLFTAAARHQKVVVRNYSNATGLEDTSSRYTQSRWMPTFGTVYKPWSSCRCMLTIPKRCSGLCGADDGGQCRAEYRDRALEAGRSGRQDRLRYDRRIAGAV